jgi:hypothetical protein
MITGSGGGTRMVLDNITFESGSAVLTGNSNSEIARIKGMLDADPSLTVKIVGHTDSQGGEAANRTLSSNRARAVYNALVNMGISASRMSSEGMGESSPIADNSTAAGRAQNRRTELVSYGASSGGGDGKSYTTHRYQRLAQDATAETVEEEARYENRSYQKLSSGATTEPVMTPSTYGTRTYQRLVNDATSESIEEEARYENRSYQKVANDASSESVETEAQYTTRSYQKLANDATTNSVDEEARYENRSYQKLASAATTRTIDVPAEYKTVSRRELVKPGGFTEWKEVVCESDITSDLVRRVQNALISRGYDIGSSGADNRLGASSKAALVKFQKDNGLPIGSLDFETLRALGIK